jgi:CRISPR-associated protein Cas1
MYKLQNTLYLTTPESYLHLEQNNLRVDIDKEKRLMVPLHHIGAVVCFGPVMISPAAMHRCADEGISLVLLDWNGRFKARLEGATTGNILLRQAQFRHAQSLEKSLDYARAFIAGKIRNTRYVLLRAARDSDEGAAKNPLREMATELARILKTLPEADTLDALRGYEGEAARRYFDVFNWLVRPDVRQTFRLRGRTRRPPLDRMNALLSFLYALVMNDCRSALESVGLDPQMGFLHTVRPGRAALALDVMEEFRPVLADRLALTLVNRLQLSEDDLRPENTGAVRLTDDARKQLVVAYQERKKELVSHPMLNEKLPLGVVPHVQARLLARVIRGDAPFYLPYQVR